MDFAIVSRGILDRLRYDGESPVPALLNALQGLRFTHAFGEMSAKSVGSSTLFAPRKCLSDFPRQNIFCGHAVLDHGNRIEHQFGNHGILKDDPLRIRGQNGVFCLISCTDGGTVHLFTDPSGQYHVHILETDIGYIVSNNLNILGRIAADAGFPLRRATTPILFALGFRNHFGRSSGFEDVRILPPRTELKAPPNERLSFIEYRSTVSQYAPTGTYKAQRAELADGLKNAANSILDIGNKTFVDVTAGVDSRVGLAAFLSTGRKAEFDVHNFGSRPNPDRMVPEYLMTKYGLAPTDALVDNQVEYVPLDQKIPMGVFKFCGLRTIDIQDIGPLYLPNTTRVTGGFGELACGLAPKTAVHKLIAGTGLDYARDWIGNQEVNKSFLRRDALELVIGKIALTADDLIAQGIARKQVDLVIYAEHRTPFHFGIAHRFFNEVRYHLPILNFLEQVQCAGHMNLHQILNRKLHLDLIVDLAGWELALEPMAKRKWPARFLPEYLREAYAAVKPITTSSDPLSEPVTYRTKHLYTSPPLSMAEHQMKVLMNAKGLNSRFQNALQFRSQLSSLVEIIPDSDRIWDFLDMQEIKSAISRPSEELLAPENLDPQRLGRFAILANSLTWYLAQEVPCPIHQDGSAHNA